MWKLRCALAINQHIENKNLWEKNMELKNPQKTKNVSIKDCGGGTGPKLEFTRQGNLKC